MKKLKDIIKDSVPQLVFAAISILVGLLSALLTKNNMQIYNDIKVPAFAPPMWLFPVAWTVLYILMGISAGIVYKRRDASESDARSGLWLFWAQLAVNFLWSIVFFNLRAFPFAVLVLFVLLALVILMTVCFYRTKPIAAYLQIPYVIWLSFALYLTISIAILN